MRWWTRPLVRFLAAIALPVAVPALITAALWVLPGDPAEIICPPAICQGTQELAERWGLDKGPVHFYTQWIGAAVRGELGNSWRVEQGFPVAELIRESLPITTALVVMALLPLLLGSVAGATGWLPVRLDPVLRLTGLVPAVILALVFAALVEINVGPSSEGWGPILRLAFGALALAVADGAFVGAVVGTRSVLEAEVRARYINIGLLRGESVLANALPNVLPALIGQFRARVLHILSGAVVVEVVLGIPGLGELLWEGTLLQDFGVVLAATWAFSLLSAALLLLQAVAEVAIAAHVRRTPAGVVARSGASA